MTTYCIAFAILHFLIALLNLWYSGRQIHQTGSYALKLTLGVRACKLNPDQLKIRTITIGPNCSQPLVAIGVAAFELCFGLKV